MADLAQQLAEYREQYEQIQQLQAADPGNKEYAEILAQLKEAIDLTAEVLKSSAASMVASQIIHGGRFPVGTPCQALYEAEGKWYDAKVVEAFESSWRVLYLGYDEEAILNKGQIRERLDSLLFAPGSKCMAMYEGDKKFYKATVVAAIQGIYSVKFEKHDTVQNVTPVQIASVDSYKVDKVRARMTDMKVMDIPEHLKITAEDTPEEKERKLKKLKAIKSNNRFAKKEEERNQKQTSWQSFQNKAIKKGIVKKKDSMFKSPEGNIGMVGVVGCGRGMTDYSDQMKQLGNLAKGAAAKNLTAPQEGDSD